MSPLPYQAGTFGRVSLEVYQITTLGASRLQRGTLPKRLHPVSREILTALASLGGTADGDELRLHTNTNPGTLGVGLKRLIDMGLVAPIFPQEVK